MHRLDELSAWADCGSGRCDVRIKLIVALATVLAIVMSTRLVLPLIVLVGALVWLAVSGVPARAWLCRLAGPLGLAAVIGLAQTLTTGTTPLATFELGPWQLTATSEGMEEGALIASRILGSVGAIMALCLGTPAPELFAALRWARLPPTWLEVAMLMYRYIFLLFEQAVSVVAAQKARLGYGTLHRSIHSLGSLAGIVLLRSLDQAGRTCEAMLARGYHGCLPAPSLPGLTRRQLAATFASLALITLVFFLAERWPG